ncbi:MAG: 4Fe-4S dicluster domain-containing protein [Candidatus Tectomicrobia bacterium]|uniref:4Fe-4S dicluster domain-containing protein n=1 Tax=Tectimicrobiota bacterium TaxID=2528274 RepID=A0A933GNM2_UNCTE|nr:4Fe-4S dicluster domain-containing protein [Candidatus Tectomicrobia bacterium]
MIQKRGLPTINIDNDKCPSPMVCGKCLNVCPAVVMGAVPRYVEKFRETPSKDYMLVVMSRPSCSTCMRCVEVCPEKCITITMDEPVQEIRAAVLTDARGRV